MPGDKSKRWSNAEARKVLTQYENDVQRIATRLRPAVSRGQAIDEDDLCAEGRLAVLEALESYQGFGVSERTWVNTRIRQRMIDAIRRLDIRTRDELRLAMRYASGQTESEEEAERGRAVAARQLFSLDCPGADGRPLMSRICDAQSPMPDDTAHRKEQRRRLIAAMETLTPRQRSVLKFRLFQGMSLREVGDQLDITESRASQLQKRAVERLTEAMQAQGIQE
ncbi:MAG: sigma-70 family RNA polymerase sigma factor [Myxococcales bacterium]|nr:sigma-70 family RNA polymerase sigma factor [Myxococcales bacterium]MDD9968304.1 sigma-70 family RNA polymerase sigma factor [Myxococcales bacterium]